MPRLSLLAVAIAVMLFAFLALSTDDVRTEALPRRAEDAESLSPSSKPAPWPSEGAGREGRSSASAPGEPTGRSQETLDAMIRSERLRVLLLDESLEVPIIGHVENTLGDQLATTTATGQARLSWPTDGPEKGLGALKFSAVGFSPVVTTPTPLDLERGLVVRLTPTSTATLNAVDRKGAPVASASVRIIPKDRLGEILFHSPQAIPDSSWSQTLLTDAAGVATFALSSRAIAEAVAPNGVRAQVWLQPGGMSTAVLDQEPASLVLLDDATGEPLTGFLATIEETDQPAARPAQVISDTTGAIAIPSRAPGVVLTLNDPRCKSMKMAPHPSVTPNNFGTRLRFDNLEPTDSFSARVKTCSVALRLVDATTGLPLDGVVTVDREHGDTSGSPRWNPLRSLHTTVQLVDGHCLLGCTHVGSSTDCRTRLHVPGYRNATVLDQDIKRNAEPQTIQMERAGPSLTVAVWHADGLPAKGTFVVRDRGTGSMSPPAELDTAGTIEFLDWSGEDLEVSEFIGRSGSTRRVVTGTIAATSIRNGRALLVLPIPDGRGGIVIEGAPDSAPPVLAVNGRRHLYGSVRRGSDRVIADLPSGKYLVGTRGWLDGIEAQFHPTLDDPTPLPVIVVTADTEARVPWNPAWAASRPLIGRVIATPERLKALSLVPWYGLAMGSIPAGYERRVYLDPAGRYLIPAGQPVPERLLVCPTNDSYWIEVLQSFLPGENVTLTSGSLTVEWEGPLPLDENLIVFVEATDPKFDAPFELFFSHGYYRDWTGAAPITFGAVSTYVDHIRLDAKGYERATFPVTIHPQIEAHLKLSLKNFETKAE